VSDGVVRVTSSVRAPWFDRRSRSWFAPVPTRRIEVCRSVTFGYAAIWLVLRAPYVWDVSGLPAGRFEPVGVLELAAAPPGRAIVLAVWATGLVACALAAAGRYVRSTTSLGAAAMLFVATLTSSFGQVFHTEHLLVIHLVILAVAALAADEVGDSESRGWPLRLMAAAVVVAYVVAGIAKLRFSGWDWVSGDVLRNWVAADNLRKVLLDDPSSGLGGWLAGVAWIWMPIAVATLVVELGAPLALLGGRIRTVWVAGAWSFHVGVVGLMAIVFPYQLSGVAYLAFFEAERLGTWVSRVVPGTTRHAW